MTAKATVAQHTLFAMFLMDLNCDFVIHPDLGLLLLFIKFNLCLFSLFLIFKICTQKRNHEIFKIFISFQISLKMILICVIFFFIFILKMYTIVNVVNVQSNGTSTIIKSNNIKLNHFEYQRWATVAMAMAEVN